MMYEIKDKRFHPLIWKLVKDNRDYFLSMYDEADLSGYSNDHAKCGYIVGCLYDFIAEKKFNTEQAFNFLFYLKNKINTKPIITQEEGKNIAIKQSSHKIVRKIKSKKHKRVLKRVRKIKDR